MEKNVLTKKEKDRSFAAQKKGYDDVNKKRLTTCDIENKNNDNSNGNDDTLIKSISISDGASNKQKNFNFNKEGKSSLQKTRHELVTQKNIASTTIVSQAAVPTKKLRQYQNNQQPRNSTTITKECSFQFSKSTTTAKGVTSKIKISKKNNTCASMSMNDCNDNDKKNTINASFTNININKNNTDKMKKNNETKKN